MKQLERLIDVIKLRDMTYDDAVKREMALISVTATSQNRAEIIQPTDIFNEKIINAGKDSYIIEVPDPHLHRFKIRLIIEISKLYREVIAWYYFLGEALDDR